MVDEFAQPAKQPFRMPETAHPKHADGIYFGLPEEEYLADPALGSSGIKDLLKSPLTYWTRSQYNPNRLDKDSAATTLGTYVHDALLDQSRRFAVKPEGMSFATKDGKAWRDAVPAGQIIITFDQHKAMLQIMQALDASGVRQQFTEGEPEVSIFWTLPNGIRCKCRIDYLKPEEAIDVKTYANAMDKDLETAVSHTVANYGYSISALWYDRGIEAMQAMLSRHGPKAVHGDGPWLPSVLTTDPIPLWFIFLQTDGVPNITERRFVKYASDGAINGYWRYANNAIAHALTIFERGMAAYGPDRPWIPPHVRKPFDDLDFVTVKRIIEEA